LISDYFPVNRRAAAIALYNVSLFAGFAFTFGFGGFLDTETSNWRQLFLILGIPGIIFVFLLIFTLRDPERGKYELKKDKKVHSFKTSMLYLIKRPSIWCLCLIGGVSFMMANASTVWQPTFYYRVHHLTPQDLAFWMTWISPISGILGSFLGGISADLMQRKFQRGYVIVCIVSIIVSSPFLIAVYLMPTGVTSILCFLPSSTVTYFLF
jgi:sugar phosphate permease